MKINTYSALEKALKKVVQDVMEDEVAEKAIHVGQKNVADEVYAKYTPYSSDGETPHYERTYKLMTSFRINPIDGGIEFYNDRHEDDRYIVPVIEYGQNYEWGYIRDLDKEIGARPFMESSANDLRDGKFKQAMIKGLSKRGIDAK